MEETLLQQVGTNRNQQKLPMELVVSSLHMKEENFWPTELSSLLVPSLQCTSKMFGVTAGSVALLRVKCSMSPLYIPHTQSK